jgi:hypothetical protein
MTKLLPAPLLMDEPTLFQRLIKIKLEAEKEPIGYWTESFRPFIIPDPAPIFKPVFCFKTVISHKIWNGRKFKIQQVVR